MRGEQAALLRYPPIDGHPQCGEQPLVITGAVSSTALAIPFGGECWVTIKPTKDIRIRWGGASVGAADATRSRFFGGQTEEVYVPAEVTHFRVIQADEAGELTWWRSSP